MATDWYMLVEGMVSDMEMEMDLGMATATAAHTVNVSMQFI